MLETTGKRMHTNERMIGVGHEQKWMSYDMIVYLNDRGSVWAIFSRRIRIISVY